MNSLLWIGLLFPILTETALHTSDVVMVSTLGDSVTLPCAVSSGSRCSSVTWTRTKSPFLLVSAGEELAPNTSLLRDCSLQIKNVHIANATTYICENSKSNSSVDLRILDITENNVTAQGAKGEIELHCFLNNDIGLMGDRDCNNAALQANWLTGSSPGDNAQIKNTSTRFHIERVSNCFLKLHIRPKKQTDHHRKWRCQVSRNGSLKATASYMTTVENGIEEVFAAVGESLSLACANASSLGLTGKGQTTTTSMTYSPTTIIIHNVSPVHAGDYLCSGNKKASTIRLHTFDITSELDPGGKNITLSCVLTCANGVCDEDFTLTWSEEHTMYSTLSSEKGKLLIKLSIPLVQMHTDEAVCSVLREGLQVATKKWHLNNSLPGLAWIAVPFVLLCLAAVGVYFVYRKRKQNRDPEHIKMTHVYEDVGEYEPPHKREAVASNDSFYDLLQAVN